jgi:hypothetical protein
LAPEDRPALPEFECLERPLVLHLLLILGMANAGLMEHPPRCSCAFTGKSGRAIRAKRPVHIILRSFVRIQQKKEIPSPFLHRLYTVFLDRKEELFRKSLHLPE